EYVDVRLAGQIYFIDPDVASEDDENLFGWNARGTTQVKLINNMLRIFGTVSYRRNEQVNIMDVSMLRDFDFRQLAFGAGTDFTLGPWSIGGMIYGIFSEVSEMSTADTFYLNLGTTYYLVPKHVAAGFRWGRSWTSVEPMDPRLVRSDSFLLNLRLLI
ncbi:MAG: hypothetical protein AAGF12_26525, partial [Myxococcota bacterium]